jgi:hypothetical protein
MERLNWHVQPSPEPQTDAMFAEEVTKRSTVVLPVE